MVTFLLSKELFFFILFFHCTIMENEPPFPIAYYCLPTNFPLSFYKCVKYDDSPKFPLIFPF